MTGKQLKNSILQWAIQGKLVPQDPNDEPASVLLEKIRQEKERLIKEKKIKQDKNASIIFRGEDNSYYEKFLATGEVKCIDEEIPFEIPQGWEWCRLSNIGITETGTTPSKTHPEYFGDYMPFLGPANILDDKIVRETQGLSFEGVKYGRVIPANSILQVCIGGSIGKCAIVHKEVTFNQQINSLTPIICCVEYVHYVLQSETFRLAIIAKATGTATPIINRGNWEQLLFPLPPLVEQHRIVATLNVLKDIIAHYSETQIRLQDLNNGIKSRLSKSILQEAIQGKLVPQDSNDEPASVLLEKIRAEKAQLVKEGKLRKKDIVDSVIYKGDDNRYYEQVGTQCKDITEEIPFEIPKNWSWRRLGNIISISSGENLTSKQMQKGNIPVYGGNGITGYHSQANVFEETIVIGRVGYYCGSIHLTHSKAWVTDNAFITRYNKLLNRSFLIKMLTALELGKRHSCTAQPVVSGKNIYPILIPIPPLQEQQRIVAQIEKLFEQLK